MFSSLHTSKNPFSSLDILLVIATSWDTVSFVKKLSGYKMYFVQDYEPYFYPFGELSLLAKKTYEQGLHMVSFAQKAISSLDCFL